MDLSRCAIMLERESVDTVKADGRDAELWLRFPGAKRFTPKLIKHLASGLLVATLRDTFLVTAGHVADRMDGQARLSFRSDKGRRSSLRLSALASGGRRRLEWTRVRHADVAALRISAVPAALRGRFLPASLLPTSTAAPTGEIELTIVGFPLGLASETHFRPIAKRAHPASGMLRLCENEGQEPADFFLLDQPSVGGYSGAPVFVLPQLALTDEGEVTIVNARCVGIVSRTISDDMGGQFAAVVPAAAIHRTLAKAKARRGPSARH